jgi:hypothetical protein
MCYHRNNLTTLLSCVIQHILSPYGFISILQIAVSLISDTMLSQVQPQLQVGGNIKQQSFLPNSLPPLSSLAKISIDSMTHAINAGLCWISYLILISYKDKNERVLLGYTLSSSSSSCVKEVSAFFRRGTNLKEIVVAMILGSLIDLGKIRVRIARVGVVRVNVIRVKFVRFVEVIRFRVDRIGN